MLIWFKVAYLMLVAKKGRSALEIHRTIYGDPFTADYHTTWYMCTRLRAAMRNKEWSALMGEVEAEFTFRHNHKGSSDLFMELLSRC